MDILLCNGGIMNRLTIILPRYAWIPLIASVLLNFLVYSGNRFITTNMYHFDFSILPDQKIPFVAPMIIFYVLSYITWVIGFVVIAKESKEVCYEIMSAEQLAKLLCLICYIAIPTTMVRAEISGNGFFEWLTRLIYFADQPDNLFPSIHCLESWMCFRGAMRCKKVGHKYKAFMLTFALLVFASTVLVKQHVLVDILGGIAVVEISLFLVKKCKYLKIYSLLSING